MTLRQADALLKAELEAIGGESQTAGPQMGTGADLMGLANMARGRGKG